MVSKDVYVALAQPFKVMAQPVLSVLKRAMPALRRNEGEALDNLAKNTLVSSLFLTQGVVRFTFFPDSEKYKYLDAAKLESRVARYISYYSFDPESRDFPRVRERVERVPYTVWASGVFIRYTLSSLTASDLVAMGLTDSKEDVAFLSFDQRDRQRFLDAGRMIATRAWGLCGHDARGQHFTGTLRQVPRKYEVLASRLARRGSRKCVVYTNFSARTVSAYLHSRGVANRVMRNEESDGALRGLKSWAQSTAGSVVVLDSRYSEGVSFQAWTRSTCWSLA